MNDNISTGLMVILFGGMGLWWSMHRINKIPNKKEFFSEKFLFFLSLIGALMICAVGIAKLLK